MKTSQSVRILLLISTCVLATTAGCTALKPRGTGPRIYIATDLEGASGVYQFAQTRETATPLAREAREYLMGDIAAAVRGLRDAGAGEIVVLDGHGNGACIPHLMEPGARYIVGGPRSEFLPEFDKRFDGLVMLAHHAMMGTSDGVLHHTQSSRNENRYWYNGVESGELAQSAAIAGYYGVPPILVTGDEATCREATHFFGAECVTVATKKGQGREAAVLYPFAETRRAIYEGAKRAVAAIPRCRPYHIAMPCQARKQHLVFDAPDAPGRLELKEGTIEDVRRLLKF